MLRTLWAALLLGAGLARAQAPLRFEAATVKPAPPPDRTKILSGQIRLGVRVEGQRVDIGYFSLAELIRTAYAIKPYQLEGPGWMNDERWDVEATLPEGATDQQVPQMLRALLAERFHLEVRRRTSEHPVYALVVGSHGPKLIPAAAAPPPAPAGPGEVVLGQGENQARIQPAPDGRGAAVSSPRFGQMKIAPGDEGAQRISFSRMALADLADLLTPYLGKPVVDDTGLEGHYQVELELAMADLVKMAAAMGLGPAIEAVRGGHLAGPDPAAEEPSPSIGAAVEKLGLKLDSRMAALDTITVERLEKIPTEN